MRNPRVDWKRMLVESLVLATKLQPHFPFPGSDPVLGNRHCAVRVRWLNTTPDFSIYQMRPMPRSHWDVHDQVFFSSNSHSQSWSAIFVHCLLRKAEGTCIPVKFFVSCRMCKSCNLSPIFKHPR